MHFESLSLKLPAVVTPPLGARTVRFSHHQIIHVSLGVILALAMAFRTTALATYGFSQDEVAKVRAVESYARGEFGANAEHPMLMKLAMWASLRASTLWNSVASPADRIAAETALRLPNALAGAATVAAVYAVSRVYFGWFVGVTAALLVALDPNVTAINRIGKEDTFLVFFFLLAVWCYERGKHAGTLDMRQAQRWYTASGAAFGLMLASKYMPHFFGIYALFNALAEGRSSVNRPVKAWHYGAMAAALLIADFTILNPETWRYAIAYTQGPHLLHHGYRFAQQLYVNDVPVSLYGVPPTYYLQFLMTKVPLPVLGLATLGLLVPTRQRARGLLWVRLTFVLLLVSYSLMAPKALRYALPMLVLANVSAAIGLVEVIGWLQRRARLSAARMAMCGAVYAAIAIVLLANQARSAPFYAMHQNAIGRMVDPRGLMFPEEAYDYGLREAAMAIAATSGPRAAVVSDGTEVLRYYLERKARHDLEVRSFSSDGLAVGSGEQWVLVQESHVYFENELVVAQLRLGRRPWREYRVGGRTAVEVFRLPTDVPTVSGLKGRAVPLSN